jgi:hypothetical protein
LGAAGDGSIGARETQLRFRKRYLVVIAVVLLVFIEVGARVLQRPNRINLNGERPYLLETTWHQEGDYAQFIPVGKVAGCWSTALAQIGHYHRLTPTGTVEYETSGGYRVLTDLDAYEFRHGQIVSRIDDDVPVVSREQVAKYIYTVAVVIHKDFGGDGYLDHQTFVERLESHLDCSVAFHEFGKDGYLRKRDEIRSLVMEEIESRRPIMFYFDNGKDFGHAAVIDGYAEVDDAFVVHLNMGWGGRHNGWYDLFDRITGMRDDLQTRFLVTIKPQGPARDRAGTPEQ